FNDTATTEIYTLSLYDALPICAGDGGQLADDDLAHRVDVRTDVDDLTRSTYDRQRGVEITSGHASGFPAQCNQRPGHDQAQQHGGSDHSDDDQPPGDHERGAE